MLSVNDGVIENKIEEKMDKVDHKGKFNFIKWLKGSSQKEFIENTSFLIIFISSIMVSLGVGLGSFVQGTILIAIIGAFFVIIGIINYMVSQFIGE